PVARCGLRCGDLPAGFEAAKVVDTHAVRLAQRVAEARDPPVVAATRQLVPAVERVAPALAGRRKVVGWHAGDDRRLARGVELEQLRPRPDVGAVVGDEDRDVTEQPYAARVGVPLQLAPLFGEQPLHEAVEADLPGELLPRAGDRLRLPQAQLGGPAVPRDAVLRLAQRHKRGEVVQPGGRGPREPVQLLALARV